MKFGVDSAAAVTSTAALKEHGVQFSARYISPPGNSKNITRGEAEVIQKGGLDVVLVWETNGDEPLLGANQGVQDARLAKAEAEAVGAPAGSPIFFAFDRDPSQLSAAQWTQIAAYYKAVASVIGKPATGAYGGYAFIKGLFDKKLITYGWQTYGWSGGVWDLRAQLRQYLNGQQIGGMSVDFNHALTNDYGQWGGHTPVRQIKWWSIKYKDAAGKFQTRTTKHPSRWAVLYKKPFRHGDVTFHRVFK